jgi:anti-anti-sigma regulatory factor
VLDNLSEIDCGGVLDITEAAHWCAQASTALQTASEIRLKAESIQRIDAAGLQAILCLILSAKHRGIPIHWDNPSPALRQAATLTGLNQHLMLT